jgi:hypothetical protein
MRREPFDRGKILTILQENRGMELPIEFGMLQRVLDTMGTALSAYDLREHLTYLQGKEYVSLTRRRDLARPDRMARGVHRPDDIVSVRLTPQGADLIQGAIAADPGVQF